MNASNCHLLKTESSKRFCLHFIQSVMACLNFQNTSWWLILYVLEALVFQNTSKRLLLSSLRHRGIFFLGIYLKNHPKKTCTFILMMRGNSIISFYHIFFHYCFLRPHSSKTSPYWRNLKHLRVCILHDDRLNDSSRHYC